MGLKFGRILSEESLKGNVSSEFDITILRKRALYRRGMIESCESKFTILLFCGTECNFIGLLSVII